MAYNQPRNKHPFFALCLTLSCCAVVASCGGKNKNKAPDQSAQGSDKVVVGNGDITDGLTIALSEGTESGVATATNTVGNTSPLSSADAEKLLARMPNLLGQDGDTQDFALREKSQPPPRTGTVVEHSFPPAPTSAVPPKTGGALTVTRFAPEGSVPLAPHLSVSFSQPMVAITSHGEASKTIPVQLSPQPKGSWRWVGTKTLLFDPDQRFPMATEYKVAIDKGVKSANGDVLEAAVHFQFVTPSLTIQGQYPSGGTPQRLQPLVYLAFDQRISPDAVLPYLSLQDGDRDTGPLRLATDGEIAEDKQVNALVLAAKKRDNGRRWIVVRPLEPLPNDSRIAVVLKVGAPSAEGPLTTTSEQSFWFQTYGPFTVEESRCNWGGNCPPGSHFSIRFSNPIDDGLDAETIVSAPAIAGQHVDVRDRWMSVRGQTLGQTSYEVTIPAGLKDAFGQTLGADKTLTFKVGKAQPRLFGADGLTIADPARTTASFDVHSVNIPSLDVKIYQVGIGDWEAFGTFTRGNPRRPEPAPGTLVVDTKLAIQGDSDKMVETSVDLSAALNKAGKGHAVIVIEPTQWADKYKPRITSWVQVTDIGLDAFADSGEMIVWTTQLKDGKPLAGIDVSISHTTKSGQSDGDGLAALPLDAKGGGKGQHQVIVAKRGDDIAFLPQHMHFWSKSSYFVGNPPSDSLRWFSFDDRGMYKPGETVNIKGWVRTVQNREGGDITQSSLNSLKYTVMGPRGNTIGSGTAPVNALGGYDFKFTLPKTPNLGHAYVQLVGGGGQSSHSFQIQEFRRPEFEVKAEASQGPHIVGKGADVTVSAQYYAGGPLPSADTTWTVTANASNFTPPNRSDYTFGTWVPWWGWGRLGHVNSKHSQRQNFAAKTDASGKHVLHMDFVSVKPPRPMSVVVQASVMDVNRQAWATSTTLLVHPSDLYIGLARDRYYVDQGTPIKVTGVIVDQDGAVATGQNANVRAVLLTWVYKNGKYEEQEEDPQNCPVVASDTPFVCEFATPVGGRYKIIATVTDKEGRSNQTEITTWVSGGELPPERDVKQESITLIPDKKEYAHGDTAKILLQAPFFPADAVLSIRRSGIVSTRSFHMDAATKTIEVTIDEGQVPNVYVQVDLVGSAVRVDDNGEKQPKLPRRPAYAKGMINLSVPPTERTLQVAVVPAHKKLAPGVKTEVSVTVKDATGKAVANADVAVMVVDEAVLALSGKTTPDAIAGFYAQRSAGGVDYHLRQWIKLATPVDDSMTAGIEGEMDEAAPSAEMVPMAMGAADSAVERKSLRKPKPGRLLSAKGIAGKDTAGSASIAVRKNFAALAAFAPSVSTDANGMATVSYKVPDNLTRYRIMVVAASGANHFGTGEASMTARMPLMVRPSPPRFLNFGDKFELPVVLQNQTDKAMQVKVAVRAINATIDKDAGQMVDVPANDRVEVRFPSSAQMAGIARFQVAASSENVQDANEFALPVWTPATTEAFATYGEIDSGAIQQPVQMPPDVVKNFGGMQISMSSTQLQALTDALLYLVQYPYECSEQTASRIMGVSALRDVLGAFKAEGLPSKTKIEAAVERDIARLSALQNRDGGFSFWVKGYESWPYNSIFAAHALNLAKAKGYRVPEEMLNHSKRYLQSIETHIPHFYSVRTRRMLIAYALFVRKDMGDLDLARATELLTTADMTELSIETLGRLIHVLHGDAKSAALLSKVHRYVANKVSETAATAHWVDGYSDDAHLVLYSSRRADGVMLEALIEDTPKSDLIPKVVRGLLAHRVRGKWGNTQENVFVLLAMDKYFQAFEKATPNFVARLWLGEKFAGEQKFRGRSTERHTVDIPMQFLATQTGSQDLVLSKQGRGRLYYRMGMTYAPADLQLPPADHGFAVERSYEGVDDPADVVRHKDGSWQIKAGTRVRVRLTMVAENRRYHVALVDPLPAGLETMNPALAVTGAMPQDTATSKSRGRWWWWSRTWYEHQNMRDERVEAFTSLLWAGVHKYSYVTRATTPGRFIVPPTKAEEMYFPETFGRSGSDVVIVQ